MKIKDLPKDTNLQKVKVKLPVVIILIVKH